VDRNNYIYAFIVMVEVRAKQEAKDGCAHQLLLSLVPHYLDLFPNTFLASQLAAILLPE
jgi:hypothetical protein